MVSITAIDIIINIFCIDQKVSNVLLQDILVFFTGSSNIPPPGFGTPPLLHFDHEAIYPSASTCATTLVLPTRYDSYDKFKNTMVQSLLCNGGFGVI